MSMQLNNKHILVTGASADSEIGMAICRNLAAQGARLLLMARRENQLQKTQKLLGDDKHIICPFDLTDLDEIPSKIKSLVAQHGRLDGIVHSASFQGYSPLKSIKSKQINDYFDINVSAAIMLVAALSKKGMANQHASAVLIGSAAGLKGLKGRTLYATSKAALSAMVKSAALELANKGIRVNCVAPAVVAGEKAQAQFDMLTQAQADALKQSHPMGLSAPEDVANTVGFLLSHLSKQITGTTIAVDGGYLAG